MTTLSGHVAVALRRMDTLEANIRALQSRYGPRVDTSAVEFGFDQVLRALQKMQRTTGDGREDRSFSVQVWFNEDKTEGEKHEGVTAVIHHASGCLHLEGTEKHVKAVGSNGRPVEDMVADWYPDEDWYAAEWADPESGFEVCIVNAGEL